MKRYFFQVPDECTFTYKDENGNTVTIQPKNIDYFIFNAELSEHDIKAIEEAMPLSNIVAI